MYLTSDLWNVHIKKSKKYEKHILRFATLSVIFLRLKAFKSSVYSTEHLMLHPVVTPMFE